MSDSDALVPCPCCGFTARFGEFHDEPDTGCPHCGATLDEQQAAAQNDE